MSGEQNEPTLDIARGDVALSKHLKNSLGILKDKVDDPEFKRLVDDITSGRRSLRDMMNTPVFARALDPLVERGAETYRDLSEEEREQLARQGEEQFEQLRQETENPSAAQRPDEDGDDGEDEDFSDRTWMR
ncbi:hypothetical protein DI005_25550 [Prauserella sp. PE36]|uniref:Uncharacterized protein n=1 Tax=Prauserella endophytica TaxID=1592324 RepID=A0ABY2S4M9_9PSEU|nr:MULTISPECIES: hypothetical protein [Prauserella]PXY33231.1 hypothetical protein BAY59_08985 [Prauserella coralliicola]RBM16217.1 hypothetical protein DI005_25550 [Prauserella sp. PE36]TKG70810.1 hypothetical protein FCN18_14890 [Prauserella endophytica]